MADLSQVLPFAAWRLCVRYWLRLRRDGFFVHPRTLSRDLAFLREQQPKVPLPLRSTVHDIGPVLTHRVEIVRLALDGKTTTEISRWLRHSPASVTNYVSTFARCASWAREGMDASQIAFLLRRGKGLIQQYLTLLEEGV